MKTVYRYIPLCWIDSNRLLVCNRKSQLWVHVINSERQEYVGTLPISSKERSFMRFSLTARVMRLVNFTCCPIDECRILIAFRAFVYLVDISKKTIQRLFSIDKGKRPLFFCSVTKSGANTEAGVYYGDYCSNSAKNPISIYHVDPVTFEKRVIFTFAKGEVNHVHSLVYDEERDCVWIFTGDFGDAAAIWRTRDGFKTVECVLRGKQDYRADVVTIYNSDIWYATDAPFAPNHLMRLYESSNGWGLEKVAPLNGPVIYGSRMGDKLVFSTDVESDGEYKNRFDTLTSRKLGKGIKDYYAYLYTLDLRTKNLKIIYRCKKDLLPFVVFQFGTIMFPSGESDGWIIPAFHVALNRHRLKTLMINNG